MKTMRVFATALGAALLVAASGASAEEVVARYSGSGSGNTPEFEARAPWIMEWVVSGEEGQYEVIEIGLVNASTGQYEGVAVKSKMAGSGVRLFENSGHYYFRIASSLMNWHINVIELTEDEAKQYQPVQR